MKASWVAVTLCAVLCAASANRAHARDTNGDGVETILLPLALSAPIPGALGTIWREEIWLGNANVHPVYIQQNLCGGVVSICELPYPAGYLGRVTEENWIHPERGVLLYAYADDARLLTLSARILETSRRAQPQGFELPVVREGDFLAGASYFVGIPSNSQTRVMLRVYDPRRISGTAVKVEVLDDRNNIVAQTTLTTSFSDASSNEEIVPGFASISDMTNALSIPATVDHYHVRVTPLTAGTEYWAMVSVTDNDTQQVLIITPQ